MQNGDLCQTSQQLFKRENISVLYPGSGSQSNHLQDRTGPGPQTGETTSSTSSIALIAHGSKLLGWPRE